MPSIPRALLELGHRHHHHHHQEVELCPRPLNLGRPLSLLWPVDKVEVTSKVRSWQWHALPPGSFDMLGIQPPSCEEASKQPQEEPVWTGTQTPCPQPLPCSQLAATNPLAHPVSGRFERRSLTLQWSCSVWCYGRDEPAPRSPVQTADPWTKYGLWVIITAY